MKIIILVLTNIDKGFHIMDKCVKNTWGKETRENVEIFYNYADPSIEEEYIVDGCNIICKGYETYENMGRKTLKAMKYLADKDFDFLLRVNNSSFIHIDNLISYLKDKPNKFYAGFPIAYHTDNLNIYLASGSSYILSKDLVKYVVDNEEKWDHSYPEDVSLGKLMYENNIKLTPKEWVKILEIPSDDDVLTIGDSYQIRCKIETGWDPYKQCEIMNKLYKLIYEKNNI